LTFFCSVSDLAFFTLRPTYRPTYLPSGQTPVRDCDLKVGRPRLPSPTYLPSGLPEAVPWGLDHVSIVPRPQLSINCPAPLLERLKAAAADRGMTLTGLVLAWLEAGLDGDLEATRPPSRGDLEARLEALEAAVAALQPPARIVRVAPAAPAVDGVITSADLAALLGVRRGTFNARLQRSGGAHVGMVMDGWRCVGQQAPANGGPMRWCWESIQKK
jgi:hypothetical protein